MKLKKLTIHNIASIADAEIDFCSAPLASSDVFLICGETGAGKTTILDSICLALFGSVPRLQLGGKAIFDEIKYNDERQMLRSGCGEGSVTLSFTGNDNNEYESCWSVRRARNKADGKFQGVLWSLKSKNLSLSKTTEVRKAIIDALGIDYEQFVRTSMLAQGEFTRFLKAEDSEKAVILKKLTGTDRFTRIGAEIYRLTAEKQHIYETLRERISMEKILSVEEEGNLREEYARFTAEESAKVGALQRVLNVKTWLETLVCLQKAVEASAQALDVARTNAASPEIADKRLKIKFWRATEPLRQALQNLRISEGERKDAEDALKNLQPEYARALGGLQTLLKQKEVTAAEYVKISEEFKAEAWRAPAFSRYEEILTILNSLIDKKSDLSADWQERRTLGQELSESDNRLKAAKEDFKAKDEEYKKTVDALTVAEKLCNTFDFKSLVAAQEAAHKRITALKELATLKETYTSQLKALDKEREGLSKAREELKEKENTLSEKKNALKAEEQKYEEARLLFETLKFTASTAIASARAGLKEGCQCPVCLQKVDILPPAEEIIKSQYDKAQAEEKTARANLEKSRNIVNSLEASVSELRKSIADNDIRVSNTQNAVNESRDSIAAKEQELGINETVTFEAVKAKADSVLQKADEAISTAITTRNTVDAARTIRDNAHKAREKAITVMNQCDKYLTEKQSKYDALEERIRDTIAELRKAGTDFIAADDIAAWKPELPFRAEAFLSDFIEKYGKRQSLGKHILALEHQKNLHNVSVDECNTLRDVILAIMPQWKATDTETTAADNAKPLFTSLSQKVTSQSDRHARANAAIMRHEAEVRRLKNCLNEEETMILPALEVLKSSDIDVYEQVCREADEAVIKVEASHRQNSEQLAQHSSKRPDIEDDVTVESLADTCEELQSRIAQINQSKGDISRRLQDNADARNRQAEMIAQADAAHESWLKWSRLNELLGSATGDKFNRIAQSFVLKALLDNANYYLSKLTDRYRLSGRDGQFIILVRDAFNGNNERPVSTVSGGESFMTSLALALALADAGTAFSSDVLFIDEGFGTLSGEPLQRAVGMLRSLHRSSGKRVGIISHVEALRNEIPVQIRVNRNPSKGVGEISVSSELPTP